DGTGVVGDLHATQVGLVLQPLGVQGVSSRGVALPQVHGGSHHGGITVGHVDDVHGDLQRDTVGGGVGIDAGAEVSAFDATGLEHIGPVGAVTRVGTGGLSGRSEEHTSELQSRFDLVSRRLPCATLTRSLHDALPICGSRHGGITVGHVDDVHGDLQRDTVGGGVGIDAGAEVSAFDATGLEHIGPVGAVTRVGTGGLSG